MRWMAVLYCKPSERQVKGGFALCAGAAITGGRMTVEGCGRESLQGDVRFADVMGLMGARVEWSPYSITITGACVVHLSVPLVPLVSATSILLCMMRWQARNGTEGVIIYSTGHCSSHASLLSAWSGKEVGSGRLAT
jgi:hypothetical protein